MTAPLVLAPAARAIASALEDVRDPPFQLVLAQRSTSRDADYRAIYANERP